MSHKNPYRHILILAMPITLGMLSQNIMSLIDTYMVGKLGSAALAAVGIGGFVMFLCHAVTLGMSTGVQAVTSKLRGQDSDGLLAVPLNAALIIMIVTAPLYSLLLYYLMPTLFPIINPDPEVVTQAVDYSQARVWAVLFVGANFAFRGYLAATHMLRIYLFITLLMHSINVFLNYGLIYGNFGFSELGVQGAGMATLLASAVASITYIFVLMFVAKQNGFLQKRPSQSDMRAVVDVGLPYGLQQTAFAAGFTVLYWMIGIMGTVELAAATVVTNITLFVFLPGIGLSITAATLVGQAHGGGDAQKTRYWARQVVKVGAIGFALVGMPFYLFPHTLLSLFISDAETLEAAITPLRLAGLFLVVEAFGLVLTQAIYAVGSGAQVMKISVGMQWMVFLPLVYIAGPFLGLGLAAVWGLQVSYRTIQALLITRLWLSRSA